MNTPLLETKLYIPPLIHDRVIRSQLIKVLNEGLLPDHPLILLSAPAGYGKTTILSEWIHAQKEDVHFAWFSLDPTDNDPVRFFSYLTTALTRFIPGISALINDLFASPTLPAPIEIAAVLINPLNNIQGSLVIILDDVHTIHNPDLFAALGFLIEHLPSHVHFTLASRSDPPLPLHRLRARGQLVELRLHDLKFSKNEIKDITDQTLKTSINDHDLFLMESKTEGWIAGIRMMLLSKFGKDNLSGLLQTLSGQQRFIMDFLSEEVLNNQSEEIQTFLMQTALLDRFCSQLCDAVTMRSDGKEILEMLERMNCFLIPLDENRHWYRYHHLFADLLRVRMKQYEKFNPGKIKNIYERAGAWFDENQHYEEAVQQYVQAGNFTRPAEIVEQRTIELFSHGRLHQLLAWIRLLPEELTGQRPGLIIYQAWALAFASRPDEAERRLINAESSIENLDIQLNDQMRMQAEIRAIRSLLAVISGNINTAIGLIDLPKDSVPKEFKFAYSVHCWSVGYGHRILGNLDAAIDCFEEVLQIGYEIDNLYTIVSGSVDLGEMLRQKGELKKAEEIFRSGLKRSTQSSSGPGFIGRLEAFLANILVERRELNEAGELIERAILHNQQWENPNHSAYTFLIKARYYFALQKYDQVKQAIQLATDWTENAPVVSSLQSSLALINVNLWLATGMNASASTWLSRQNIDQLSQSKQLNESDELLYLAFAKVLRAEGKLQSALEMISMVENAAREQQRILMLIQALVLKACTISNPSLAVPILKEALELGLPRGFRQVYIEHGMWLKPLLESCQEITGISEILAVVYQSQPDHSSNNPLTKREVDILRWMAVGFSNDAIGQKLFISYGTVKAHTASIYRKLDVANRTEAIAKAKDMGLI